MEVSFLRHTEYDMSIRGKAPNWNVNCSHEGKWAIISATAREVQ